MYDTPICDTNVVYYLVSTSLHNYLASTEVCCACQKSILCGRYNKLCELDSTFCQHEKYFMYKTYIQIREQMVQKR